MGAAIPGEGFEPIKQGVCETSGRSQRSCTNHTIHREVAGPLRELLTWEEHVFRGSVSEIQRLCEWAMFAAQKTT